MEKKVTRKNSPPIKVYALPEERRAIEENAGAAGLSVSSFLLSVGMGYRVTGTIDQRAVIELAKINGDLGRLGGLLKMWLTNDEKLIGYDRVQLKATVEGSLSRIAELQGLMLERVKQL